MEPEKPEAAAKQPMEAEAGDPVDPRELGDCLIPLASSASDGLSSYKPFSLLFPLLREPYLGNLRKKQRISYSSLVP